jgi:diguanylate cyclase
MAGLIPGSATRICPSARAPGVRGAALEPFQTALTLLLFNTTSISLELIGFAGGMALLWLAAALKQRGTEMGSWAVRATASLSLVLMIFAVWWPADWRADHRLANYLTLVFVVPAVWLSSRVCAGSLKSHSTTLGALAGFALTMVFILVTRQSSMGDQSLKMVDLLVVFAQAGLIFGGLIALQRPTSGQVPEPVVRVLASAVVMAAVSSVAIIQVEQVQWSAIAMQLAMLVLLLGLATTLLLVLGQSNQRVSDVSAAKDREAIDNDPLTKMATRRLFERQLKVAAKKAVAEKAPMALLYIDLDGFKAVNDSFGHADGDRLLIEMSARLRKLARPGDMLARVGADEMLLLMCDDVKSASVDLMAAKVIEKLIAPYHLQSREVTLTCSVGIARFPKHGPIDQLIARADAAAQAAKRDGGGRYKTYEKSMDTGARERLAIATDLRAALERGEFELYYQPKVDARTEKITAAEALIRWHHPTRGMVSPGVFIPIAEQSGLISAMGDWALQDACRQIARWRDMGFRMRVAVNLSMIQLRQPDILERILESVHKYRIDPGQLTCEITESVAMTDTDGTRKTLEAIGKSGIHLSIDDFGTGYSSLAYLRRLPAEEVKIDRSFVMDIDSSEDARAVADAVIRLAHALGKKVVAEGVETQKQADILRGLGCNQLQGYLYGKPMAARDFTALAAGKDAKHRAQFGESMFLDTRATEEAAAGA